MERASRKSSDDYTAKLSFENLKEGQTYDLKLEARNEFSGSSTVTQGTFVVNGDRHWQYVSEDKQTGLIEMGSGPVSDCHAQGLGAR